MTSIPTWFGAFDLAPAHERPALLADPVAAALAALPADLRAEVQSTPIDPELADTAAFCEHYGAPLEASANCVIAAGRREGVERFAAVVVLATARADINGAVRRHIDVRKISFAPMDTATGMTGMEYGGITPLGLPDAWPILVDRAVTEAGPVVIGSGRRASKIVVDGGALARFPRVEVLDGLTR
ncbi:YbaK/EbsC family protein [Mycolicibacterium phlei]|uniref:YbaK/EbsC family protein n=1 Tax=Mycolicibacterium phlei TaxID=1771 RepID=UPI0037C55C1B